MKSCLKYIFTTVSAAFLTVVCTQGQELTVRKLKLNDPITNEMAPFVHDSTLYFISNRKSNLVKNVFDQEDRFLYKLYKAHIDKDGNTGRTTLFEATAGQELTVGPMTMSTDGVTLIATLNKKNELKLQRGNREPNQLWLFQSQKAGSNWQEFRELPFGYGSYSVTHPSLSTDGTMLFFCSDMPGGYGGTDIYVSRKVEGRWDTPENLGPAINTAGNEVFPFWHSSGKLYFSSDGHGGMGGTDIFYSIYDGKWNTPVALAEPVNTPYDDFSCFIFTDESRGLFASNRDGSDDLYQFEYKIAFCEDPSEVTEDYYCFTLYETSGFDPDTMQIRFIWEFNDGTILEGSEVDYCFPGPGQYEVILNVVDPVTGEELKAADRNKILLEMTKQVYFQAPERIKQGEEILFDASLNGYQDTGDIQYFWNFGTGEEQQMGKTIRHTFRKKGIYMVKCEAYWRDGRHCSYRNIVVE
jgi:plastocyanin